MMSLRVIQRLCYWCKPVGAFVPGAVVGANNFATEVNETASETAGHASNGVSEGHTGTENWQEERELEEEALYPGHIPTTMLQKTLLAIGSAGMSIINPARDDMIAALGETTGYYALRNLRAKMLADPVGRQILQERPLINTGTVDVDYLGSLGDDTFGKAYWHFLINHGFSPDARYPVHFVDDPDLMYVMLRYRQVHDLFHSLTGMPPNMMGEVAVKWIEAIQTGLPMCALGAVFGPLRFGPKWRRMHLQTYLPWAIKCGIGAKFLLAVYFEKHWERNLEDLRIELNIMPPPNLKTRMKTKPS